MDWDRAAVSSALEITGDFLFLDHVQTDDFFHFQSSSFFGPNFGPFRDHLAGHGTLEGQATPPPTGVLPGVILIETMAQTAAFALGTVRRCTAGAFLLQRADVLFGSVVRPGKIRCSAVFARNTATTESFGLKAYQEDLMVARGRLTYARVPSRGTLNPSD